MHCRANSTDETMNGARLQAPDSKRGRRIGAWNLGFLWCFEIGSWCFCAWLLLAAVNCGAAEPTTPSATSAARTDRPSIDLAGEWEFKLDPLDVGRAEKWFENRVPYERKIRVPGAWNAQGVAFDSEKQLRDYEGQRLEEQKPLNTLGTLGVQRESERLFSAYPG